MKDSRGASTGKWADRAYELYCEHARARRPLGSEFWLLVHSGLFAHASRFAFSRTGLLTEDAQEVASQKTLELLQKAERDERFGLRFESAATLSAYLRAMARNGMLDTTFVLITFIVRNSLQST